MTATPAATGTMALDEHDASARHRALAAAVRRLRTRTQTGDTARALQLVGGALMPLGFVLILLGWFGASRTVNLYEQIPYSISGGLLGTACVFAGGFFYFAYWLTQVVRTAHRDAADNRIVLERIERLLSAGTALATPSSDGVSSSADSQRYVVTATGTMYHRPDCQAVANRDRVRTVSGEDADLVPCRLCQPADR